MVAHRVRRWLPAWTVRNPSITSVWLSGQRSSARTAASTRTARRSLSTKTPSQSKMTSCSGSVVRGSVGGDRVRRNADISGTLGP